ncbi:hypothetical protein KR074_009633, partial [Drosophila pseudoananassae]
KHRFRTAFFISFIMRNMLQNQGRLGFYIFLLLIAFHHISLSQSQYLENDNLLGNRTYFQTKLIGQVNSTKTEKDYMEKYSKFENSVAAVLIKVAYGTTSTTKRSIPENSYGFSLTTVATPFLTTQRYNPAHQQHGVYGRQRNYELDLERDHALPTSAPNADILKSNNNPTYPNPNRHHSHERDRHRNNLQYNSTPNPLVPNIIKKANGAQPPTIPMYAGDVPSYSPPSRTFFTPPLPPEFKNPFADKPTLRGSNNEGLLTINRRPIPPPSLMPSQDRIPIRPPELSGNSNDPISTSSEDVTSVNGGLNNKKSYFNSEFGTMPDIDGFDKKKNLNTPARASSEQLLNQTVKTRGPESQLQDTLDPVQKQEVLPNIRRILGSNGNNGDIPAVLLKQVTQRPILSVRQPPSSPIVVIENTSKNDDLFDGDQSSGASQNINQSKNIPGHFYEKANQSTGTTPSAAAAIGDSSATSLSYATTNAADLEKTSKISNEKESEATRGSRNRDVSAAAAASAHTTWTWAWNIHIYLSVVLFTILSVYLFYKLLTYNKLTHLFTQSYFVCINLTLIVICIMRIFFLCFDAYNIHGTFNIFSGELLLNLPSTFLTVAFSVLILFLFLKSLNHKNNRYSALIRPLTVVVGCGVHVLLCVTLHYVESYTLRNQNLYFQQQQQQQYFRRQQLYYQQNQGNIPGTPSTLVSLPQAPRVLTLICQIIYIFICLSLGFLYLYLYRILKRILRSKSQNYIHGYQNLSYAIHITIATALLFVLMAGLQIFGAICISTSRQTNIFDVDWLQWGYQFSLRLLEISIIALISWVTGLKTNIGHNSQNVANSEVRTTGAIMSTTGAYGQPENSTNNVMRQKNTANGNGNHNSNVTNFFLPCTSSSSQEHFETDYPAICNTNTNLHTYTMRTGKLIYDDSYALNSIGSVPGTSSHGYQLQEPMYQRPYDTGSICSTINSQNIGEYASQTTQKYHHNNDQTHPRRFQEAAGYISKDCLTESTPDHYENPNFNLRSNSKSGSIQSKSNDQNKLGVPSFSASKFPQQQVLLECDSYSEPLKEENTRYEFNTFERPVFKDKCLKIVQSNLECRQERDHHNGREQHLNSTLECKNFKADASVPRPGDGRWAVSYNEFDQGTFNGLRKSGTSSSIANSGIALVGVPHVLDSPIAIAGTHHITTTCAQTKSTSNRERAHYYQKARQGNGRTCGNEFFKINSRKQNQLQDLPYDHDSEEDEEEEDITSESNVECTNLISNENGDLFTEEVNKQNSHSVNGKSSVICVAPARNFSHDSLSNTYVHGHVHLKNNKLCSELSTISSASVASVSSNSCATSSASDSMLVTDQGFLRFRSIEDSKSSQIGLEANDKETSRRHKSCSATVNGIDC